ncbi:MAG: LysM peptidoglycan-binding domain-containing protein [Elusimicrobiales bacterium]|nr:LysM peptidoglycan-binding domain-containing protein [Elusimicrobiales bacterium]
MKNFIYVCIECIYLIGVLNTAEDFQVIKVKPGQTLWEISHIYLKDPTKWDEIVKYNNLPKDPYQIIAGKELKIPINLIKEEYRAAKFDRIIGDVRIRPVDETAWKSAKDVKDVFKGDTIKTGSDSYADIRFYTGQLLNIFANSMIVIKPPIKDKSDIRLVAGQIKAKDTSIITVSAKITPKVKNTEIAAKIREDLSTVVHVYKGEAEVEGKGKIVTLKEGFATEVRLNSTPSVPQKVPNILTAKIPPVDTIVDKNVITIKAVSNTQPPKQNIELDKKQETKDLELTGNVQIDLTKTISGYRIQVAKDKEFNNIVFDRKFDVFKQLDLKNYLYRGKYYFRISYIDLIGFEGDFSQPKEIVIE